ncbi:hypothetical protein [Pseudomonas putida]|uniref:hypothetical protein n=1 Tax=Pseudomonas putida TaxID=303 RepID=UPI002B255EED|nr:hypothetical protein [Pseudomonas putida]
MGDVRIALQTQRLAPLPGCDDHSARIAYLVLNPACDPIELDVGCPGLGLGGPSWPVLDGNHRLAAAIFREDEFISAQVSGDLDHAFELFQVDCEEPAFKIPSDESTSESTI